MIEPTLEVFMHESFGSTPIIVASAFATDNVTYIFLCPLVAYLIKKLKKNVLLIFGGSFCIGFALLLIGCN